MPNTTQFERPPYSITSYSVNSGLTEWIIGITDFDRDGRIEIKLYTGKTRMIGLPYGEKTVTICWAVFIWYRNVTDGQNCYINIARQYMLTCDKNSKWSRSYSHSGQSRLYMHRLHSRRQTPVLYHIAYIYLRYMPALQRNSGHCIHQLLPEPGAETCS